VYSLPSRRSSDLAPVGAASAATARFGWFCATPVAAEAAPTRAARSVGTVAESTTAALGRPWWLRRRVWLSAPGARLLRVAALELVDATAGVDDLVLAGVERMRRRGHFDLDQRVLLTVVPFDRLLGGGGQGGAGEEPEIGSHVLEDDFAVFGMDVGLHGRAPGFVRGKSGIVARLRGCAQAGPQPAASAARTRASNRAWS